MPNSAVGCFCSLSLMVLYFPKAFVLLGISLSIAWIFFLWEANESLVCASLLRLFAFDSSECYYFQLIFSWTLQIAWIRNPNLDVTWRNSQEFFFFVPRVHIKAKISFFLFSTIIFLFTYYFTETIDLWGFHLYIKISILTLHLMGDSRFCYLFHGCSEISKSPLATLL